MCVLMRLCVLMRECGCWCERACWCECVCVGVRVCVLVCECELGWSSLGQTPVAAAVMKVRVAGLKQANMMGKSSARSRHSEGANERASGWERE